MSSTDSKTLADTSVVFEDLSGVGSSTSENPYDALIEACENDPAQIQARYELHRQTRNRHQRSNLLAPGFPGMTIDPILEKLSLPQQSIEFVDPRHCLVFWARPPKMIRDLIGIIQQKLLAKAPNLWLMPLDHLHMTALEITHSLTQLEIEKLVTQLQPKREQITDYTLTHRARLVKPMLGYDGSAVALSFLPASGEGSQKDLNDRNDSYTYHHLRRDLYGLCRSTGVKIASRYTVPSSHLTVARFITQADFSKQNTASQPDHTKMLAWVEYLEDINKWLTERFWFESGETSKEGGEWIVGQEKGLDHRKGTLWYGGGETVRLGQGF